MKKSVVLLVVICLAVAAYAQEKPKTKLEEFSLTSGTLKQKEFIPLGKQRSGMTFEVLKITDLNSNMTISGLRVEAVEQRVSGYSETHTAFLDDDEVPNLVKALDFMIGKSKEWDGAKPTVYTEFVFTSRSGIQVALYQDSKTQGVVFKIGTVGSYSVATSVVDLSLVKGFIEKGFPAK